MSKRGSYYHEDDMYDDDDYDEDYDEDEEYEEASPPQQSGAATKTQAHTRGPPPTDVEQELLNSVIPAVRAVVGNGPSELAVVAALRTANYDADAAVAALLDTAAKTSPAPPAPTTAAKAPAPTSSTPPVALPRKGAKLVVVGGGGGSPAPPSSPPPPQGQQSMSSQPSTRPMSTAASPTTSAPPAYFPSPSEKVTSAAADADGKQALSLIIAGHVDTGKSTILGHLLVKLGIYSQRDVSKLEQVAKREGKASFHFAWILDQSEEERRRGVTIDSGVHSFETEHRRVSVSDAPGHKDYVTAMITSAATADVALLTVSAAPGEYESGLRNSTSEHLAILRTLGITRIIVLVNKMDTVRYDKARYSEVVGGVSELAKTLRFRDGTVAGYCPISGYHGVNLLPGSTVPELAAWYDGPSLIDYVDRSQPAPRMLGYPLRFAVSDITKQILTGKVETGVVKAGDVVTIVPSGAKLTVRSIERPVVGAVKEAQAGNTAELTVAGDLIGANVGDVVCPPKQRCPTASGFEAHVQLFSNLPKVILPGTKLLVQLHSVSIMATVKRLLKQMDPKTGKWGAKRVKCLAADTQGLIELELPHALPMELAEDCRSLGRFVLRMEDETIGGGLVKSFPGCPTPAAASS